MEEHRKLLDQLFGVNRNKDFKGKRLKLTDPEVCKPFLLSLCPYDLFTNTVRAHVVSFARV